MGNMMALSRIEASCSSSLTRVLARKYQTQLTSSAIWWAAPPRRTVNALKALATAHVQIRELGTATRSVLISITPALTGAEVSLLLWSLPRLNIAVEGQLNRVFRGTLNDSSDLNVAAALGIQLLHSSCRDSSLDAVVNKLCSLAVQAKVNSLLIVALACAMYGDDPRTWTLLRQITTARTLPMDDFLVLFITVENSPSPPQIKQKILAPLIPLLLRSLGNEATFATVELAAVVRRLGCEGVHFPFLFSFLTGTITGLTDPTTLSCRHIALAILVCENVRWWLTLPPVQEELLQFCDGEAAAHLLLLTKQSLSTVAGIEALIDVLHVVIFSNCGNYDPIMVVVVLESAASLRSIRAPPSAFVAKLRGQFQSTFRKLYGSCCEQLLPQLPPIDHVSRTDAEVLARFNEAVTLL